MLSTIPIWGYPVMVLYAIIADAYTGWLGCFSLGRMLREMLEEADAEVRVFFRPLKDDIVFLSSGHTISSYGGSFVALTSDNAEAPQGTPYSKSKPHWTRFGDHGTAGGMQVYCNSHGRWWNEGRGGKPCKLCNESGVKRAITSPICFEYEDGVRLYRSGGRTHVSPPYIWEKGRCEMCCKPRSENDPSWGARKFCSFECKRQWERAIEKHRRYG